MPRTKLHPYRLLILIMYHDYSWVTWDMGRCRVLTSPLARLLRVSNSKIREYANWLLDKNYISGLKVANGYIAFTPVTPKHLIIQEEFAQTQESEVDFTPDIDVDPWMM